MFTTEDKQLIALYLGYSSAEHLLDNWFNQDFNLVTVEKVTGILTEIDQINQEYKRARLQFKATTVKGIDLNMSYRQGLKQEMAELVWQIASLLGLSKDRVIRNYFEDQTGMFSAVQVR